MSQLNFYVPDDVEEMIRLAAKKEGKSISNFIAEIIKSRFESKSWPKDFFSNVVGQWDGDFPTIDRSQSKERDEL